MNRRKNRTSTACIQQGISKFVEESKAVSAASATENTGARNSTSSSTSNLKRKRQGSNSPGTEKPLNKGQVTGPNKKLKTMDSNNTTLPGNNQTGIELNPELCELKRQLFEGF